MKILIVDDNASVLNELTQAFAANEFEVDGAENGLAALSCIKNNQYDFVVTDYKMPLMDGIKLIENLMHEFEFGSSDLLLLTTDTSQQVEFKLNKLGIHYLAKPVSPLKVIQRTQKLAASQAA